MTKLESREGQAVPKVTFKCREGGDWKEVTSDELFGGRTVVVFALPGAFTPTCSTSHLPRYNELAGALRERGVDDIVCLSVNDGFVMEAWGEDQQADQIRLIPDGSGHFTRGVGMLVDKDDLGFGERSWRYSMLVRNGVIEKMFIEPDVPGDPFEVSDADTMLRYLDPEAGTAPSVALFSKEGCPHCARAKRLLDEKGLGYEEIVLGKDATTRSLAAMTGTTTVPQVFVGGERIGSAEELEKFLSAA